MSNPSSHSPTRRRRFPRVFRSRPSRPLDSLGGIDVHRLGQEARVARNLERVYHVGQDRIWDGRAVLAELVDRHGGVDVPEPQRTALHRILSAMLWGELAAWKVSAALAAELPGHEARLAATAQAHDEARHFYVLYDYIELLGGRPVDPPPSARQTLERVVESNSIAKKLVGMQLLVEPVALTLFAVMRRSNVCPVLSELLPYFERDEARHVNVGSNLLPGLVDGMSWSAAADYWTYQARLFHLEIKGLGELEGPIRDLGFDPRDVFQLGLGKQLTAARLVTDELGLGAERTVGWIRAAMEFQWAFRFPDDHAATSAISRVRAGWRAVRHSRGTPVPLAAK